MTIGLNLPSGNAVPDKTMSRKSSPTVLLASFGDGYEQRVADGINSIKETYTLSFRNRPKADIDDMVADLDANKGVTALAFTIPDTNAGSGTTTIKVVCVDYSTSYEYGEFYSLTINLRRVFEA